MNLKEQVKGTYKGVPIGVVIPFAGEKDAFLDLFSNDDFLICDGRELDREEYPVLHYVIRTTWGGGSTGTKFNLPDLRGYFLRGSDVEDVNGDLADRDPDKNSRVNLDNETRLGVGGFQADTVGPHTHKLQLGWTPNGGTDVATSGRPDPNYSPDDTTKENTGKETRPINASVLFIIRARL